MLTKKRGTQLNSKNISWNNLKKIFILIEKTNNVHRKNLKQLKMTNKLKSKFPNIPIILPIKEIKFKMILSHNKTN